MTDAAIRNDDAPDLSTGKECLINLMGQYFLSRILDVSDDRLTVTFPGADYPAPGMRLELQFHDDEGFNAYVSHVVVGPQHHAGRVVIERPTAMERVLHRQNCRVSTDLTVQVKEQNHIRKYDAALLNLSGGGALLETDAPFLAPAGKRGEINEPANIPLIAEKIAELKNKTLAEIATATTRNAVKFFNLP